MWIKCPEIWGSADGQPQSVYKYEKHGVTDYRGGKGTEGFDMYQSIYSVQEYICTEYNFFKLPPPSPTVGACVLLRRYIENQNRTGREERGEGQSEGEHRMMDNITTHHCQHHHLPIHP